MRELELLAWEMRQILTKQNEEMTNFTSNDYLKKNI